MKSSIPRPHTNFRCWSSSALALAATCIGLGLSPQFSAAQPATGNIQPFAIEIDANANLYPSGAAGLVDWVKDSLPNTDTPSLVNSIATGIIPNVTGAPGGRGHWNGLRIVAGIARNDHDIFQTGRKENDV